MPIACEPLAQAPAIVKLTPLSLKMTDRFMVTVEFIDWKMEPEPTRAVFFFSRMMSTALMTALLSLPYKIPTSLASRKASSMPALRKASRVER